MNRKSEHKIYRQDLLHPELSYQTVGILFDVYNELGPGHREAYYQRAVAKALHDSNIAFREQIGFPLRYRDRIVGQYRLDFLIENKIVLELKRGGRFSKRNVDQVLEYLRSAKLDLAILANFSSEGVIFKRIICPTK